MADQEANVKFGGDASGAQAAARSAKAGVDDYSRSVKGAGNSADQFAAKQDKATAATAKATKATSSHGASLNKLRGDFNGAFEILRKAVSTIDAIAASQIAAGEGTDIFTRNWIAMRKAMDDPQFYARVTTGLADIMSALDPFQSFAADLGKGFGDNRRGVGFKNFGNVARDTMANSQAAQARTDTNATMQLLGGLKAADAELARHLDSLEKHKSRIEKVTSESPFEGGRIAREGELSRLQTAREAAKDAEELRVQQEDEAFNALGGQFDSAREQFETDRIARIEEARKTAHEAEMARLEEEKKSQEERLSILDNVTKQSASFAAMMVNSSIDIAKAKREATKAALLEGKTSAEAARAGKSAELEARAARMDSIRQYMVMKSFEHAAEAIGAFARYDFVAGGLHLAAAAAFGAGAAIANARSNALSAQADNMQTGGFGAGSAGSGGGAANSSPRSGTAPIDSHIPGSPSPQSPAANSGGGSGNSGSTHLHLHGQVYGVPPKKFWEEADRELSEISLRKRRA